MTASRREATYLVSIAGSAGAFTPLRQLLSELPRGFDAAVVAMLHTTQSSALAEALRGLVRIPVRAAASGQLLEAGCVYVPPAGNHIIVNPDSRLTVSNRPRVRLFRPSADWLFESAAASFGPRHVCIVLSGTMSDGASMLRVVKGCGGTVLVQSPDDAIHAEMPRAAIRTGCVDAIVPISVMARALCATLAVRDAKADVSD
jgi:two-component system chemotaxis response regulator CheB